MFVIFAKMGRKLYYFHKDSGLEVGFVIRDKGEYNVGRMEQILTLPLYMAFLLRSV